LSSLSDFISKAVNDAIAKQFQAQKAGTDASSTLTKAAADIVNEHQKHIGSSYRSSAELSEQNKSASTSKPELSEKKVAEEEEEDAPPKNARRRPYRNRRRRVRPYRRRRPYYNDYHDYDSSTGTGDPDYHDANNKRDESDEKPAVVEKKEEPPPVELFAGPLPADKQGKGDNPLGFASVKVNPNFNHHMQAPVVISQKTLQLGKRDDDDDDDDDHKNPVRAYKKYPSIFSCPITHRSCGQLLLWKRLTSF
jgi:DNA mismatch repair ATPase MutL